MDPALGDVKVRQALNYAFDREGLLTALQFDHGTVTTQVFPATSDAYDPELDSYYDYDPEKAKELLAEAGYPDGLTISMPAVTAAGRDDLHADRSAALRGRNHRRAHRRADGQLHRRPAGAEVSRRRSWLSSRTPTGS